MSMWREFDSVANSRRPEALYPWELRFGALVFAAWMSVAQSAQSAAQFNVSVDLKTVSHPTLCLNVNPPGAFGAVGIVVCSTGATVHISHDRNLLPLRFMHGGAYRFNLSSANLGGQIGAAGGNVGAGTVTSWRMVHIADWEYLEMFMSW